VNSALEHTPRDARQEISARRTSEGALRHGIPGGNGHTLLEAFNTRGGRSPQACVPDLIGFRLEPAGSRRTNLGAGEGVRNRGAIAHRRDRTARRKREIANLRFSRPKRLP
jgi:hypothetical protein